MRSGFDIWQVLSVVLSAIAVLVSIAVAYVQSRRKRLVYFARSVPLVSVAEQVATDVTIAFRGQAVSNVRLIEFGFRNSGNVPIEAADFAEPVVLQMEPQSRVMSTDIVASVPPDLQIDFEVSPQDESEIKIEPLLLNPGDSFRAKALVTGGDVRRVAGRVVGVPSIARENSRQHLPSVFAGLLAIAGSLASYYVGYYARDLSGILGLPVVIVVILGFSALTTIVVGALRQIFRQSRWAV